MQTVNDCVAVSNKRTFERVYGNFTATIETSCIGLKEVICRNISEGGIYLEIVFSKFDSPSISVIYLRNEVVKVSVRLNDEEFVSTGMVRWIKEVIPSLYPTEKRFGVGIEFIQISQYQRNKIRDYVDSTKSCRENNPLMLEFPLFIGGRDVDTGRYEYQPYIEKMLVDPEYTSFVVKSLKRGKAAGRSSEYIYGKYCIGDTEHFNDAIKAADSASKIYKTFNVDKRAKIVFDIHNKLKQCKEQFVEMLVTEGHPRRLAEWEFSGMLKGTAPETVNFCRMNLEAFIGRDENEDIFLYRKPDGVVCIATPKNAPSSISVIGVYALMAGNAIVVKPPLSIPISTIFFWRDIINKSAIENGAPEGVVNIVIGNSQKVMQSWLDSPLVNDILYIGDSTKGIELGKEIYSRGKKPILELSGNDKIFIWEDASLDEATNALLQSFYGSAQICMVPKMAFIHQEIYSKFMNVFLEKVRSLKPGLPSDTDTVLSPVGKLAEFGKVLRDALEKGGKLVCGGNRINHCGVKDEQGIFLEPTIMEFSDSQVSTNIRCLTEENFYPLLPVIKVTGGDNKEIFEKMIDFTALDGFGLRISVWTTSTDYIDKFSTNIMHGGIIRINSSHIGFSLYLSNNGGTGKSGGPFGEMAYIWQKTTHMQGVSVSTL